MMAQQSFKLSALSPAQRAAARELWASLMPAPSREALVVARQALQQSPPPVKAAVTSAIVSFWAGRNDAATAPNPFDEASLD